MKKTILLLSAIILLFAGCKKFDDIEASKLEIKTENIEKGWDYIKISGEYSYPVELESLTLLLSEKEDMSEAKSYNCVLEGKIFSVEATDLNDGISYYCCYEYDNGYTKEKGEKDNVSTHAKPIVVTEDATNVTTKSAMLKGSVTNSDAINKITARGFCWSIMPNPTIENDFVDNGSSSGTGTSTFTHSFINLTENTTYYYKAYATTDWGIIYGEEKSFTTEELINGYGWVDLGLPSGLKWATCNIGATSPEDYGDYFAWGETSTKSTYTEQNSLTYGLSISQLESQGYIDGSGNLTSSHDAATVNWGGSWRMPTKEEQQELVDECAWTWTTQNGKIGYKVTGTNGNNIFLPAAGYRRGSSLNNAGGSGSYWSSAPNDYSIVNLAYILYFFDGYEDADWDYYRDGGLTVRPITE